MIRREADLSARELAVKQLELDLHAKEENLKELNEDLLARFQFLCCQQ